MGTFTVLARIKSTEDFRQMYRQGRWARGSVLSVGSRTSPTGRTRLGVRTKRGLKGAVRRNRLKRQIRAIFRANKTRLKASQDIIVVVHPKRFPLAYAQLHQEFLSQCEKLRILS